MALTLAEIQKIETDPLKLTIFNPFLMESDLMQMIPWESIGTLSTRIVRYQDLPSWGYRKLNEGFAESTGHFEQKMETLALGGLDIDTDMNLARASNNIADARTTMSTMAMMSAAYQFNWKFIAGNPVSDPEEFKGIRIRVDDLYAENYTDQKFAGSNTSTGILNSETTRFNFLQDVDKLIYAIAQHSPSALLMNKKLLLAFRSCLIRLKLLNQAQDMFGRVIDMYGQVRLIDIGVRDDQTTEIIRNDETSAGAATGGTSNMYTSMYAIKLGVGGMFWGIQQYPMEVRDLGEIPSKPVYRTRIDWPHGLADVNPRCLARMYGVIATS